MRHNNGAHAGENLSTRGNIIVLVDEVHRTQSAKAKSLAGQMRAALPHGKFIGMTGTPVRNLATDTFALFGEETDPGRVLHRYTDARQPPAVTEPRRAAQRRRN
ncbi:hypothetical protein [Amycolatopsis palatopharyngis]|uniref:hypothetical protein n=1 Tax=Amycolatopsis palatopharyngis TaxID=187982 RepID=UPI001B8686AD|nr:hypothetical protein [Amycolatopsis palatopharyngis]